jgi:hypothetical protein
MQCGSTDTCVGTRAGKARVRRNADGREEGEGVETKLFPKNVRRTEIEVD